MRISSTKISRYVYRITLPCADPSQPVFEDSVPEFFGTTNDEGLFLKILAWSPDALKGDVSPDVTRPS